LFTLNALSGSGCWAAGLLGCWAVGLSGCLL